MKVDVVGQGKVHVLTKLRCMQGIKTISFTITITALAVFDVSIENQKQQTEQETGIMQDSGAFLRCLANALHSYPQPLRPPAMAQQVCQQVQQGQQGVSIEVRTDDGPHQKAVFFSALHPYSVHAAKPAGWPQKNQKVSQPLIDFDSCRLHGLLALVPVASENLEQVLSNSSFKDRVHFHFRPGSVHPANRLKGLDRGQPALGSRYKWYNYTDLLVTIKPCASNRVRGLTPPPSYAEDMTADTSQDSNAFPSAFRTFNWVSPPVKDKKLAVYTLPHILPIFFPVFEFTMTPTTSSYTDSTAIPSTMNTPKKMQYLPSPHWSPSITTHATYQAIQLHAHLLSNKQPSPCTIVPCNPRVILIHGYAPLLSVFSLQAPNLGSACQSLVREEMGGKSNHVKPTLRSQLLGPDSAVTAACTKAIETS
ncbi:hypothetical protein ACRALDRAFT_1090869 [Sodiomyces alcalophilus JCM 7366]|uniref:uncharacterized protein n=1 Tax=Sodiomyces alcalophilus JCM 7366 TaxID=591952 RepID=UPI0039B5A67F